MSVFKQQRASPLSSCPAKTLSEVNKGPEWLVAPIVSKLSSAVQGRLLKAAAEVLETLNWWKQVQQQCNK